jgi:hypothetical protein
MDQQSHPRQANRSQSVAGPSRTSHDLLRGTNERVNRAEVICRESETIAQDALGELAHQRESLGRVRDRVLETNTQLDETNKNLRYIYLRMFTNKLLLSSIILMEMIIIGLQLYLKFRRK